MCSEIDWLASIQSTDYPAEKTNDEFQIHSLNGQEMNGRAPRFDDWIPVYILWAIWKSNEVGLIKSDQVHTREKHPGYTDIDCFPYDQRWIFEVAEMIK